MQQPDNADYSNIIIMVYIEEKDAGVLKRDCILQIIIGDTDPLPYLVVFKCTGCGIYAKDFKQDMLFNGWLDCDTMIRRSKIAGSRFSFPFIRFHWIFSGERMDH